MSTIVLDTESVHIPEWVTDLESFRRWVHSPEFPETGRISFLLGEVWVDMSKEQFTHNQAKGEIGGVLTHLAKQSRRGRYFPDGYLLTNAAVGLSTNPDGMFVLLRSFRSGRVRLVEGAEEGYVELQGTPDMVLEVISPSSIARDMDLLRDLYWRAGISEYWLVDVRGQDLEFTILRRGPRGYVAVRKHAGWLKSTVFGKSFRFTQQTDALGYPEFTLAVR
jgi:Uma2 family endonuclease